MPLWPFALLAAFPVLYTIVRFRSSWDLVPDAFGLAFGGHVSESANPPLGGIIRGAATIQWLIVAGVSLLALRWRKAWFVLVLVFADLAWAGVGYNPAIDRSVASQPETPAIRALDPNARFVTVGDLAENAIPMDYRLPEARGYDLPVEKRFDRLWRTKIAPEFPSQVGPLPAFIPLQLPKVDPERLRFLSLLGVDRVLAAPGVKVDLPVLYPGPRCRRLPQRRRGPAGDGRRGDQARPGPVRGGHRSGLRRAPGGAGRGRARPPARPGPAGSARIVETDNDRLSSSRRPRRGRERWSSPTRGRRAGTRRSTARTRRSRGSTTCSAACRSAPAPTGSSSPIAR